jgi:aldehyde:ferredoxin oxidoreductase
VVAFSPLTGRIRDGLSSSHFAIAAKRAGVDALVVTGSCDVPSVVLIDGTDRDEPTVQRLPAAAFWGLPARATEERIRTQHGPEWQVAAIGPARERLIALLL